MNDNSFFLILLVVGVLAAVLLLSSGAPSDSTAVAAGFSEGDAASVLHGAASSGAAWADAGADQVAGERETIALQGSGGDSGGSPVTYRWSADSSLGFFTDPTRPDAKYTAPSACDCCEAVTLTLTVTTRSGTWARDSMVVRVRDPLGCPRDRSCGESIPMAPAPCSTVTVTRRCPAPDVPCSDPCVTEAPRPPACTQAPVPCRCATGCEATWDAVWMQSGVPPLAARDRATPRIVRQFPSHVAEGSATGLHAAVVNPSCSSVCFTWSASQGWFERADTLDPVYHAPRIERSEGQRVTITFTVVDASGRPASDQIRLQVYDLPSP